MKPSRDTGIRISVHGDTVEVRGPLSRLKEVLPLPLLNYVVLDGHVRTSFTDPVPERNKVNANAVLHKMRRLVENPRFLREDWLSKREVV